MWKYARVISIWIISHRHHQQGYQLGASLVSGKKPNTSHASHATVDLAGSAGRGRCKICSCAHCLGLDWFSSFLSCLYYNHILVIFPVTSLLISNASNGRFHWLWIHRTRLHQFWKLVSLTWWVANSDGLENRVKIEGTYSYELVQILHIVNIPRIFPNFYITVFKDRTGHKATQCNSGKIIVMSEYKNYELVAIN